MIFGDTETTGLPKPEANDLRLQPKITELYLVKLEFDHETGEFTFVDEIDTLLDPGVPLDPIITKITGITDAMLKGKPTFASQYDRLCEFFLGEDTIVFHNASFDIKMLWFELARIQCELKFPWPKNHHCTVELSMPIKHHRLKLKDLYKMATGEEFTEGHRAKNDVEALVICYKYLLTEGYIF